MNRMLDKLLFVLLISSALEIFVIYPAYGECSNVCQDLVYFKSTEDPQKNICTMVLERSDCFRCSQLGISGSCRIFTGPYLPSKACKQTNSKVEIIVDLGANAICEAICNTVTSESKSWKLSLDAQKRSEIWYSCYYNYPDPTK